MHRTRTRADGCVARRSSSWASAAPANEWLLAVVSLILVRRDSRDPKGFATLVFGTSDEPRTRAVVLLRALTIWLTNVFYVLTLTLMPVGDATAIIFTFGPLFNGLYSRVLLNEPLIARTWLMFFGNVCGTVLIVQPSFLFGSAGDDETTSSYWRGVAMAVMTTLASGLVPVLTRTVRHWHWASLLHSVASVSTLVLTPCSLLAFHAADRASFDAAWTEVSCVLEARTGQCAAADDGSARPRPAALKLWLFTPLISHFAGLVTTHAYQTVTHSQTANMLAYLEIPLAFVLQSAVFHDEVNWLDLLGSVVIVSMAVLTVWFASRDATEKGTAEAKGRGGGVGDGGA